MVSRSSRSDDAQNRIKMSVSCGWCMTGYCDDCLPELKYEGKVWLCGCSRCGGGKEEVDGTGEVSR